jgi:hypothetical protein
MTDGSLVDRPPQTEKAVHRLGAKRLSILLALVWAAYLPCVNNGFIADDYVALQTIDTLKHDPFYLFRIPPHNFRSTCFVVYGLLKQLVGYRAEFFYAVSILIHFTNVALLWYFLTLLTQDESVATLSSVMFAVFQAPQEAVMWLAAINESLLALFVLLTLIFWLKGRYGWSTLCYGLALFSKESAVITLAFVPLVNIYQRVKPLTRAYFWLWIPTLLFAAIFAWEWQSNFLINNGFYGVGPQAAFVLAKSLHRLLWPWFYVVMVLVRLANKSWPSPKKWAVGILCTCVPMLPYIFMTYQTSLPSRQVYLASAVLMTFLAILLRPLSGSRLQIVFVGFFVGFNIYYLWFKQDSQFLERAAPTTQMLSVLRSHQPERFRFAGFPYPFPSIAWAASLAVPGWSPQMIVVSDSDADCPGCPTATWNPKTQTYQ